jgi:hypothetical protein
LKKGKKKMEVFDPSLLAQNMQMRQLFIQRTNRVEQPVSGKSAINPTLETSIDFNLRTTGVLEKVIVTMRCRVTNGSAATAVLSNFGASNLVERFRLRDLSNEERIDVRGRELHIFNSARQESQFGSAYATNGGTGFTSPPTIVLSGTGYTTTTCTLTNGVITAIANPANNNVYNTEIDRRTNIAQPMANPTLIKNANYFK